MQHFDGARLSPNSVRNAIWHALNEPVCQFLRTRNPRCSTVYINNILGPLARDSLCISITISESLSVPVFGTILRGFRRSRNVPSIVRKPTLFRSVGTVVSSPAIQAVDLTQLTKSCPLRPYYLHVTRVSLPLRHLIGKS